ncbi:MAG: stage II sporulation protein E [bacterium]
MNRLDIPAYQRKRIEPFILDNSLSITPLSWKKTWLLYLFAFLLSRACFWDNVFPFGLAYFAALLVNYPRLCLGTGIFIALGLLTVLPVWSVLSYIACMLAFFFMVTFLSLRDRILERTYNILLPVLSAIFLTKNLFLLLCLQWTVYTLAVSFFESLFVAVLSVIFSYGIRVLTGRYCLKMLGVEEMISLVILFSVFIIGIPSWQFGFLSLGGILGKALVLIAAFIGGAGMGAAVGVTMGVVSSLSALISPLTIGLYSFSGLLAGTFKDFGRLGVSLGFILGNIILSLYLGDAEHIIYSFVESSLALVILFFMPQQQMEAVAEIIPGTPENIKNQFEYHSRLQKVIGERVKGFAQVYLHLAETFSRVLDNEPGKEKSNEAFQSLCRRSCQSCSEYHKCWEENLAFTYNCILQMFGLTETKGEVLFQDLPKEFRYKCIHTSKLLRTINYLADIYCINSYWEKKVQESRALAANQLLGSYQSLEYLASQVNMDISYKEETERILLEELHNKNILVDDVAALNLGSDNVEIKIKKGSCQGRGQCKTQIVPLISKILGVEMVLNNDKCAYKLGEDCCSLQLSAYLNYDLVIGMASSAKEEVSGDTFVKKRVSSGKMVVMLSDGMGVGSQAALDSEATTSLLGQLLEAGVDRDTAIKTVNASLILRSGEERFSTMDLLLFDLYSGQVDFIKLGSSLSFIKKGQEVITVGSDSLPLGILPSIDIEKRQWVLHHDDLVVLITDGILDAFQDDENQECWLVNFLENRSNYDTAEDIADNILQEALNRSFCRKKDDMMAVVLKLQKQGVGGRILWV